MNNENETLTLNMKATFDNVYKSINNVNAELKKTAGAVQKVYFNTDKIGKLKGDIKIITKQLDEFGNTVKTTITQDKEENVKSYSTQIKTLGENANNTTDKMKKLKKVTAVLSALFKITRAVWNSVQKAIDFTETANKFEVSMGSMSNSAYKFQNALSEAFGTSKAEMMDFQSNFYNILSALPGLADDVAYDLSETLVNMGLDFSSLFNVTESAAMEKIQAALIGNVKSIRSTSGYDITDATLAEYAKNLGVEKSIRNLSQMEKRLLRIIVLMDEMKSTGAMADMARTIEQPANQLKVMKNQLEELQIAFGNLFITAVGNALPYINGFIMALTEIIKRLAGLLGYKEAVSSSPIEVISEYSDTISDNLSSAVSSAKELKKTLMGFDVLNVIQTPSETDSGTSGTSISPEILAALGDYDSMMDDVQMKAIEIRDSILEWFDSPIGKTVGIGGAVGVLAGILALVGKIGSGIASIFGIGGGTAAAGTAVAGGAAAKTGIVASITSKIGTAISSVASSVGSAAASVFTSVFGTGLAGVGTFAASVVAPLAAAAWATYELNQEAGDLTHTSDLLDDSISQTTKEALEPFLENIKNMGAELKLIEFSGDIISDSTLEKLNTSVDTIYSTITTKMDENYANLSEIINNADYFPDEGKRTEYLANLITSYEEEKAEVTSYQTQIKDIYEKANKENRTLTVNELDTINTLRKKMGNIGIKTLSANEKEALKIKAKFNDKQNDLNVEQISEAIKLAKEQKDKTIQTAWDEYNEKIALAEELKETMPGFTQEMYEEMTKSAKTELDQQLLDADTTYKSVVKSAQENYPEITKAMNLETGEMKTSWESFVDWFHEGVGQSILSSMSGTFDTIKSLYNITKNAIFGNPIDFSANYPKWDEIKKEYENKRVTFNGTVTITPYVKKTTEYEELRTLFGAASGDNRITPASAFGLSISSIQKKATGGFVPSGELFLAREAGPELVGKIGNQSAVVNNQQIVEAVAQGVAQAVASAMPSGGGDYNLYVDGYQLDTIMQERRQRAANIAG